MLALVTQSDGSARRIPFITAVIVLGMGAFFATYGGNASRAQSEFDALTAKAVTYFEQNPFVEIDSGLEEKIGSERIAELREAHERERRELGMPLIPGRIKERTKQRLDEHIERARTKAEELPAWQHGVSERQPSNINYFKHAFVHLTLPAIAVSLLFMLLVAPPLEDIWGSIAFSAVCVIGVVVGAGLSLAMPPGGAEPFVGASALIALLLGASIFRSFSSGSPRLLGGLPLPAVPLAVLWLAAEYFGARAVGVDTLHIQPFGLHVAMLFIGCGLAFALKAGGLEPNLADRWDELEGELNPLYERAMQLRDEGQPDEGFTLLRGEFEKKPNDRDIALGLWDLAVQMGQPAEGAQMALSVVRAAMRAGDTKLAIKHWNEVVDQLPGGFDTEPALVVRAAEMLAREGETERSVEAARIAIGLRRPLSGPLAVRAIRVVQPHDAALANEVAALAARDPQLGTAERNALEQLVGPLPEPGAVAPAPAAERAAAAATMAVPSIDAMAAPAAAGPAAGDANATVVAPTVDVRAPSATTKTLAVDDEQFGDLSDDSWDFGDENEAIGDDALEDLDPNALALDETPDESTAFEDPILGGDALGAGSDPAEVERWNSPGLVEDLSAELPLDGVGIDADSLARATDDDDTTPTIEPADTSGGDHLFDPNALTADFADTAPQATQVLSALPDDLVSDAAASSPAIDTAPQATQVLSALPDDLVSDAAASSPAIDTAPQATQVLSALPDDLVSDAAASSPAIDTAPQATQVLSALPDDLVSDAASSPAIDTAPQATQVLSALPDDLVSDAAASPAIDTAPQATQVLSALPDDLVSEAASSLAIDTAPQATQVLSALPDDLAGETTAPTIDTAPQATQVMAAIPQTPAHAPSLTEAAETADGADGATQILPSIPEPLAAAPASDPSATHLMPTLPARPSPATTASADALREIRPVEATPVELKEDGLVLDLADGKSMRIPWDKIDGLAVGAVAGLGGRTVVVIDLVLNWGASGQPLKVMRMRSDRFDPRKLVPGEVEAVVALRSFLSEIFEHLISVALPSRDAVLGNPFASFASLADYHARVLGGEVRK